MELLPIDLTAIVATIMGISIVLVPVIGLTARFALKPLVESMGQFFQSRNVEETIGILERRMALLEQHMETMDTTMMRLSDAADFHRELSSGARPGPRSQFTAGTEGGPADPPGDRRQ